MSKTSEKNSALLQQEISLKQLLAWATALKTKYQRQIFFSTRVNIIVFHVFFVLVMVIIFYFTLEYVKVTILSTIKDMLTSIINGGSPDPTVLQTVTEEVDYITRSIAIGTFIFAIVTGVIAAQITLRPTRKAVTIQKKFISSIAHELRTPLAILRTTNEVALYDVPANAPVREVIIDTINQTKHLTKVLDNLLVFSRIDTNEAIPFESITITEPVERANKRLQHLATKKGVAIKTSITATSQIRGNATALEQAIYNILKNAITYSNNGAAPIKVTVTESSQNILIICEDHGTGMSQQELVNIFTPFYRVRDDRGESDSMGLGLALVYEIIKMHGGSIEVSSAKDTGSIFTISLPIDQTITASKIKKDTSGIKFDFTTSH